jgi:hypothetical protein
MEGKMRIFKIIFLFLFLPCLISCMKELKDVREIEWELSPEFGMPLARAELALSDAFQPEKDSALYIYPDQKGILHLCFNQNVDTMLMDDLLSEITGDQVLINDSIELPRVTKGIVIESPITYFRMYLDSFLVEEQIDSLLLNKGVIEFEFKTWQNYLSDFSVQLPDLTDANKNPIQFLNFEPQPSNYKVALNLRNSRLKINTSPTSKGIFTIVLGYRIIGKSTSKNIAPPVITIKMYDFDIRAAYGKMGNFHYDMDPINIDLFDKNPLGKQEIDLDLAEPKINLLFLNQFGFPFRFDFSLLGVINNDIYNEITGVQKSVTIQSPGLNNRNVFTQNILKIDPSSNLDHLISKFPQKLVVDGEIVINPDNPGGYNYIREEDMMVTRVEADIPLRFSLSQISIKDTASLDLNKLSKIEENIDLVKLQTKIKNGFPLGLNVQAYFTDDNLRVIDSLFTEPIHMKPAVSSVIPSEFQFVVDKNNAQIRKLKNCKQMIAQASFTTGSSNSQVVDFDTSQKLSLEIIGFTRINF